MADGNVVTKDCLNTGHRDCWTPERRAEVSMKRRKNGTNHIGASCFTGKIKCVSCGCNTAVAITWERKKKKKNGTCKVCTEWLDDLMKPSFWKRWTISMCQNAIRWSFTWRTAMW